MVFKTILLRGQLASNILRVVSRFDPTSTRLVQPCLSIIPSRPRNTGLFHTCTRVLSDANEAIVTDEIVDGDQPWMSDLKKRGLYSEMRYRHYHKYKVSSFSISEDKRNVTIDWNDGHTSNFDAIWLRHVCYCGDCKHDTNGMGKIDWDALPLDISVLSAELEDGKMMVFRWGTPEGKELHQGAIPTAALRCYCYSDKTTKDKREQRAMIFHEEKTIPQLEYDEVQASEEGLYKCLTAINEKGICLVKNVPTDLKAFLETVNLIGPVQNTMYGNTFDVYSTPNPINAAYSSSKLNLHMDLPFYETSPGLQILHCCRFDQSTVGGSNTFVDIHEVAHKFRREQPELFDRLARYPIVFNSIHYNRKVPVHMENQKTIFSLNHYGELVSVTWHPMVQGPTELPKKDMVPFYEAYTAFYKMISQYTSLYKNRFEEGDFVVFNNRRILHGREAYSGGGRHLQGGYIELSDYHSHAQALHNKCGDGRLATRSGSHSWQ